MVQNQGLEGSGQLWGGSGVGLGRFLGVSWLQGTSWQPLARLLDSSWAIVKASGSLLGRLLGRLGQQARASWSVLEASCSSIHARIVLIIWHANHLLNHLACKLFGMQRRLVSLYIIYLMSFCDSGSCKENSILDQNQKFSWRRLSAFGPRT